MTVKSVIGIDLQDEEFKNFVKLWEKFREQVKDMPTDWGKVGGSIKDAHGDFGDLIAAMAAQAVIIRHIKDDTHKQVNDDHKREDSWKKIAGWTKQTAGNLKESTRSLLRWTSIGTIVSGLVGAGGLFGIDRLTDDIASSRRSAFGLGTAPGSLKAFSTEFSRFVDPEQFLGGVNDALHDITKQVGLRALGVSPGLIATNDATQVGSNLLLKLKDLADRTNPQLYGQAISSYRLEGLVSPTTLQTLHGYDRKELVSQGQQMLTLQKELNALLDPKTVLAAQQFSTTLQVVKTRLEAAFVNGIQGLLPGLEALSKAVGDTLTSFLTNPHLKDDMRKFGDSLGHIASYMGSDQFKADVQSFALDIHTLASAISDALHKLGKQSTKDAAIGAAAGVVAGSFVGQPVLGGIIGGALGGFAGNAKDKNAARFFDPVGGFEKNLVFNQLPRLSQLEQQYKLPANLLAAVYGSESAFGANAKTSSAGAQGPFQFMPGTSRALGVLNPLDFNQASMGGAHLLSDLIKHFHGNLDEALAAWNVRGGQGRIDADIKAYGEHWKDHLPKETQSFIKKTEQNMDLKNLVSAIRKTSKNVHIKIENNSSGNAVMIANTAGSQ